MEERAHRQHKDALKAHLAAVEWPQHHLWVLQGLRGALKEDSSKSLAKLLYGAHLALPAQLTAEAELPVEKILEAIHIAEPLPTRQGSRKQPAPHVHHHQVTPKQQQDQPEPLPPPLPN